MSGEVASDEAYNPSGEIQFLGPQLIGGFEPFEPIEELPTTKSSGATPKDYYGRLADHLKRFVGKSCGVNFGSAGSISGKMLNVTDGVIEFLYNDNKTTYIVPIHKINFVWTKTADTK